MNRLFWAGVGCTLLLSIICSFNILNAAPNEKPVPAKPAAAPAKPAAAPSRKKIGLIAASSLPVAFGVLGEMMAQILHYIAS
ncbi:unnamed protein product [Heterobilharzia americana]|nr:unnamed protein product [Heterobilharzia americana]CAH8440500.1 unnamed protein product [Heterobilharzia americana]CAH8442405.1 unnamed protein product [Heterobilharzia americana]